jgi:phosphoribosylformylglycinamidine (FGAM) synthase PurS component
MSVVIRVGIKPEYEDVKGTGRKNYIETKLGIPVKNVSSRHLYVMEGITKEYAEIAAQKLLKDNVVEYYEVFEEDMGGRPDQNGAKSNSWLVRVGYKMQPLVLDAWGDTTKKAMKDIGIDAKSVRHLEEWLIEGELGEEHIKIICKQKLADEKVQNFSYVPAEVGKRA